MATFIGPVEAFLGLQDYIIDRTDPLPHMLRERLRDALRERSTVDAVAKAVEMVYARDQRKNDVPDGMLEWASAASAMMEAAQFHGMAVDGRGSKMARKMRRQSISAANTPAPDAATIELVDPSPVSPAAPPPLPAPAIDPETPPADPAQPATT